MYLSWVEPPVNIVKSKNKLKSIIFAVACPFPPLRLHPWWSRYYHGTPINIQCIKNSTWHRLDMSFNSTAPLRQKLTDSTIWTCRWYNYKIPSYIVLKPVDKTVKISLIISKGRYKYFPRHLNYRDQHYN